MTAPSAGVAGGSAARAQVARLLTLVPLLHARGSLRLAEAAEVLGVEPDQVLADLKVLLMCGLPGGYPDDLIDVDLDALEGEDGAVRHDGLIRVDNADYLGRPLRLTPTEASAIIVALRALREGSRDDTAAIVDRVLAKLERAASTPSPAAGPPQVDLGDPGDEADRARNALAADLERAVAEQRQVRLRYFVPARDEVSERVVDPRGLVEHGGHRYLDAWCHSAGAPRLFRLDRVDRAEVLDHPVTTEATAPRDLSAGLFQQSDRATTATVRLAPPAQWVTEYYPVQEVRPVRGRGVPRGSVDVDLLVADPAWLVRLVMRLAPHAEVRAPAEFTERSTAAAQATLGLYP